MKFKASILFAKRLLAPRTGKKSNARKSLQGAFLCIGISLIPLVMVLTVSNGMIEGITSRMIGLSSSHLSCYLHPDLQEASSQKNLIELSNKLESCANCSKDNASPRTVTGTPTSSIHP